jgi:hypothetical protein
MYFSFASATGDGPKGQTALRSAPSQLDVADGLAKKGVLRGYLRAWAQVDTVLDCLYDKLLLITLV